MDHLCPCVNGKMPEWMRRNGKFNGTVVCDKYIIMIQFKIFIFISSCDIQNVKSYKSFLYTQNKLIFLYFFSSSTFLFTFRML